MSGKTFLPTMDLAYKLWYNFSASAVRLEVGEKSVYFETICPVCDMRMRAEEYSDYVKIYPHSNDDGFLCRLSYIRTYPLDENMKITETPCNRLHGWGIW